MKPFVAACVQNLASPDLHKDIAAALALMREAAGKGAQFVALPELCVGLDIRNGLLAPAAFAQDEHPAIPAFAGFARDAGVTVLVGSIGVLAPDGRVFNRSLLIDGGGRIVATYDKIHLFDIDLGADGSYKESASIAPGGRAQLAPCLGTTLGMSVCYDVRFPHLYRAYAHAGAALLSVPAAFTRVTGQAHWHTLLRARAIENGAFVIAPGQTGRHVLGPEFYGHSLIVDPWGEVLADGGTEPGVVVAEIDPSRAMATRRKIPSLANERSFEPPVRLTDT